MIWPKKNENILIISTYFERLPHLGKQQEEKFEISLKVQKISACLTLKKIHHYFFSDFRHIYLDVTRYNKLELKYLLCVFPYTATTLTSIDDIRMMTRKSQKNPWI